MHATITPRMSFQEASQLWIDSQTFEGNNRSHYVKPRTIKDFHQYRRSLIRMFGSLTLAEIHIGHLREYQRLRSLGELGNPEFEEKGKREVGPHRINQEMDMLRRVLKRAHAWTPEHEEIYQPLQVQESDVPRALTPQEQERFLSVAASRQEWALVHAYALLAFHTTASGCEMRGLRLGDLNLHDGILMIRSANSKNKYRLRTIPLSGEATWAAARLLEIGREKGAVAVQHYLFPFRSCRDNWEPLKPMSNSGIKKPWDEVRKAAGLSGFMPHDTRHTSITRMAESGTPIPVIMSMAGHISRKMLMHYTWVCEQAKRTAVEASFGKRAISTGVKYVHNPMKTG